MRILAALCMMTLRCSSCVGWMSAGSESGGLRYAAGSMSRFSRAQEVRTRSTMHDAALLVLRQLDDCGL